MGPLRSTDPTPWEIIRKAVGVTRSRESCDIEEEEGNAQEMIKKKRDGIYDKRQFV